MRKGGLNRPVSVLLSRVMYHRQGVFQDLEMGGVPQPLGDPSLPSLPFPSPPFPVPSLPPPLPVEVGPRFAVRRSGGALKLPQRVPAEPGRQTFSGAYRAENPASGDLDQVDHEMMHFGLCYLVKVHQKFCCTFSK